MGEVPEQPETTPDELSRSDANRIREELKTTRSRILQELYKNEGRLSTTFLRSETGAEVPKGSLNYHLDWLRDPPIETEADEIPPFVETAGYEDRGHASPTKIIGLTSTGEWFVDEYLTDAIVDSDATLKDVRMAVSSHGQQLATLSNAVEENEDTIGSLEGRIQELDRGYVKILDQIEELQEAVENSDGDSQ